MNKLGKPYALAPLGVVSVATLIVASRLGPVGWREVPWLINRLLAVMVVGYLAGAILLPAFWLLDRVRKSGWPFVVSVGALAGAAAGLVMAWPWSLCAVCSGAGGLSGGIFSLAQRRVYAPIVAVVLMAVLGMCAVAIAPDRWLYAGNFRDAADVIERIEVYRRAEGHVPATLLEIGRTDDEQGPLFYNRYSEDHYRVSFSAPRYGFFGTLAYDSTTQTWQGHD